jgi:hypothetical protein
VREAQTPKKKERKKECSILALLCSTSSTQHGGSKTDLIQTLPQQSMTEAKYI